MGIDNIVAPSFIGGEFKKPRSGGYRNATCGDWNVGKMNREEELNKEGPLSPSPLMGEGCLPAGRQGVRVNAVQ